LDSEQFRKHGHDLVDWIADYMRDIRDLPVLAQVEPGEIIGQLPVDPPSEGEPFERIFADFQQIIMPGMTHWQHPSFHAYFPANSSPPSILAEMLTATLGAQCMIWQTSPSAAELEERVMEWLGAMIGLPPEFTGVIQDTASVANLCSILTARELRSGFSANRSGLGKLGETYTVYCSRETHSSVDKAVRIAGLGSESLRKIPVDRCFRMLASELEAMIERDTATGATPLCVITTLGTTSSTAIDPLQAIGEICSRYRIWLHVDAAFAGNALVLPEMRWMINGIEFADTFVFNPHKWMFTNFDCSAYFVRDKGALIRTFEILPEYLKTGLDSRVNNYRDWGIQLGRRFRALKLWFVIRTYGVEGIRRKIKEHIDLATRFASWIDEAEDFELMAVPTVTLVCFRYRPLSDLSQAELDRKNEMLLERLNASGRIYLTHTRLSDRYVIRLVVGQTQVNEPDVAQAWELITSVARASLAE